MRNFLLFIIEREVLQAERLADKLRFAVFFANGGHGELYNCLDVINRFLRISREARVNSVGAFAGLARFVVRVKSRSRHVQYWPRIGTSFAHYTIQLRFECYTATVRIVLSA